MVPLYYICSFMSINRVSKSRGPRSSFQSSLVKGDLCTPAKRSVFFILGALSVCAAAWDFHRSQHRRCAFLSCGARRRSLHVPVPVRLRRSLSCVAPTVQGRIDHGHANLTWFHPKLSQALHRPHNTTEVAPGVYGQQRPAVQSRHTGAGTAGK